MNTRVTPTIHTDISEWSWKNTTQLHFQKPESKEALTLMLRSAHQSLISTLSAVTRASWHPKSQAIWLFVQQHYQADKEKIKAPQLSFLCEGNSLLTDGFSSQRDNNAEIIMMFSVKFPWLSGLSNNLCWSDDVIQNGGWNLAALQMPTFKAGGVQCVSELGHHYFG